MKDEEIIELGLKLGSKKDNIEFGLKNDRTKTEESITKASKFMGLIKDETKVKKNAIQK